VETSVWNTPAAPALFQSSVKMLSFARIIFTRKLLQKTMTIEETGFPVVHLCYAKALD
jgi:hypothetical protein